MVSPIDDLLRLIPPPESVVGGHVDWTEAERQIGTQLPADYKGLVRHYGSGEFFDFLSVFQPFDRNRSNDLMRQSPEEIDALRYLKEDGLHVPYGITSGSEELICWGITDESESCYWVAKGGDPDKWTLAVFQNPDWYPFEGGVVDLLVAVASHRSVAPMFDQVPREARRLYRTDDEL